MKVDIQPSWDTYLTGTVSENVADYAIQTEDQAPPGTVVDARNMTIGLTSVGYRTNPTRMVININPPDVADRPNWYGVKVRVREVPLAGGTAPDFVIREIYPVPQPNAGVWQFEIPEVNKFTPSEYQIVVTPVVRYSAAKTEANTSWIGQGKLQADSTNQFTAFNFRTIESAQIPGISAQPFPTSDPIVMLKGYRRITTNNATTISVNRQYFEISYNTDHIVGLTGVRIYRRSNRGDSIGVTSSKHYGLGRWEYIDVDTTAGTGNAQIINGDVVINLRYPISHTEFSQYYLIGSSTQPLENATFSWGAGKKIVSVETPDFFIVAQTSSGFSSRGILMRPFIEGTSTSGVVSSIAVPLGEATPVSAFNNYTAGYKRNVTPSSDGSRVNVTGSTQWTNVSLNASNAYVAPTQIRGRPVV
jgi:hypothetical protein